MEGSQLPLDELLLQLAESLKKTMALAVAVLVAMASGIATRIPSSSDGTMAGRMIRVFISAIASANA